VFSWQDAQGILHRSEGYTYDISEMGAFILANTYPPVGAEVSYEMHLPASLGATREELPGRLGKVLRVEQANASEGRNGFAILSRRTIYRKSY
jgi:hypothetical protein